MKKLIFFVIFLTQTFGNASAHETTTIIPPATTRMSIKDRINLIRERIQTAKLSATTTTASTTSTTEDPFLNGDSNFSCQFLLDHSKTLQSSITSLQFSISDDKSRSQKFNETAFECLSKSSASNINESNKWKQMSEKYFEISKEFLTQASDNEKFLNQLQNEYENLLFKMEIEDCEDEEIVTTSTSTVGVEVPKIEVPTLPTIVNETLPKNTSIIKGIPFSLEGTADFGAFAQIVLDILMKFAQEAFGGLTWQNILASLFPELNFNSTAGSGLKL